MDELDLGHWHLRNGLDLPEDFREKLPEGFVYKITRKEDGKFYIGQKKFKFKRTLKPLKGKVRKRRVEKESDWKKYCSSSLELQVEMEEKGIDAFDFEILCFCSCKWLMSYLELWWQMRLNAILREDSYNGIVNVRLRKMPSLIERCKDEIRKAQEYISD